MAVMCELSDGGPIATVTPKVLNRIYHERMDVYRLFLFLTPRNPALGSSATPMNARPLFHPSLCALTALMAFGLGYDASAQSVATTPVGAVTVTIAAGTGTTRALTILSFPLLDQPLAGGQITGRITGITSSTITNSNAGWTAGALSNSAAPYLIQITSGAAKGRTFLVSTSTANTADTVTVDSEESSLVDLTSLGVVLGQSGDNYRIIPCDTLGSLLGTPETTGVLGGTTSTAADIVQVMVQGAYRQYYYNTASSNWLRVGPNTPSATLPIRPDTVVVYSRLANTSIPLVLAGAIPVVSRKAIVRNTGVTTIATGWPKDMTLGTLGLNLMSGWVSSTDSSVADTVTLQVQGAYRQYYHNGSSWIRIGPGTPSDGVVVPAGSGFFVGKKASTSGSVALNQDIPYAL